MADNALCPKRGRRTWLLRGVAVLLLAAGGLSLWSSWTADFSSTAYERRGDGELRHVAGRRTTSLGVFYNVILGDLDTSATWTDNTRSDRPFSRSSISIVDISGTHVSRRLAHALMRDLLPLPYIDWVDVRIAGETLDAPRIGELVVVIEEIQAERSWWTTWSTHHVVHLGSVPEYGTGIPLTESGACFGSWEIKAKQSYFGSPLGSAEAIATRIAGSMQLVSALEGAATKLAPAPRVPEMLLPPKFEAPGEAAVATATGLDHPPVLRGVRAGVRGETLWRYEGSDAVLRFHRAVDELERQGWVRHPSSSRSPDGEFQRAAATRGTESVEWIHDQGRRWIMQKSWPSKRRQADGRLVDVVNYVQDPELPPVVWVHYRNEMDPEQLRIAWQEAEALGTATAEVFVSNLSRAQRALLGISEPVGAQ